MHFLEWKCMFVSSGGPVDNIYVLFQILIWRRPGDNRFSEPMMISLLTHICVTQPQWVNGWLMLLVVFHELYHLAKPGARLTKAYGFTIERYRNSHANIENTKMHILQCMGSKFCVKFQGCPLKFQTNFRPIHRKVCILRGVNNLTTFDISELWHLKSWWDWPLLYVKVLTAYQ